MIITFNVKAMKLRPIGSTAYWRSQGLEGLPAVMPLRERTWVYTEAYQGQFSLALASATFLCLMFRRTRSIDRSNPSGPGLVGPNPD